MTKKKLKTWKQLKKQKRYTRDDLLMVFVHLENEMVVEGFSRVLDAKVALGYSRNDGEIDFN